MKAVEERGRINRTTGPVPTTMNDMTIQVEGLGWHGSIPVVGAPSHSECYGVVAPPRAWGRGLPNATRCTSSTAF
jgi:hypothetical protein